MQWLISAWRHTADASPNVGMMHGGAGNDNCMVDNASNAAVGGSVALAATAADRPQNNASINVPNIVIALAIASVGSGCATAWKDAPAFYRSVQTHLSVASTPLGKLYVDDKLVGETPVSVYLDCEQEVKRRTRNVSYWKTEPGYSTLFTVLSLGLYAPFSAIPADSETSIEPTDTYKEKSFRIRVSADGYAPWEETVKCSGEKEVSFEPVLVPM
jgi:hypothetical protein